jgi:hypothetical protein
MIFLSHNRMNKNLVEPIFVKLKAEFPEQQFFYDDHSIQPGDSIVGKMSEGLKQNSIFFLFWSEDASKSKMVEREWQVALSRSVIEGSRLIVVKLDTTPLPAILGDLKYLDFFSNGYNSTVDSMKMIIKGENTFVPKHQNVSNLSYDITEIVPHQKWTVKFRTIFSVEYGVIYFVASKNIENIEISFEQSGISMGGNGEIEIDQEKIPVRSISTMHKIVSPGVPETVIISIKNKDLPTTLLFGVQVSGVVHTLGEYKSTNS